MRVSTPIHPKMTESFFINIEGFFLLKLAKTVYFFNIKKLHDFVHFNKNPISFHCFSMQPINSILTILETYHVDERWYPVIGIIIFILCMLIIYWIFASVRLFISWLWRTDEIVESQKENNEILMEIYNTLNTNIEQNDILIELLSGDRSGKSEIPPTLSKNGTNQRNT